jgi:predicted permease
LIAQLAMCTVLLIGAGLLLRTVINLRFQELGFDRNVLLVTVSTPQPGTASDASSGLVLRAKNELSQVPGIRAVGITGAKPLDVTNYWVDGSQQLATDRGLTLPGVNWTFAAVGPGFFEAAGVPLIRGRTFTDRDSGSSADAVIINQSLARFLFGDENAVGRRIRMHPKAPMRPIVGVVNDARQISARDRGTGVIYVPLTHFNDVVLAVRTAAGNPSDRRLVRQHLMRIAPQLTVQRVRTVAETLDAAIARERLMSGVSLVLAALAIAIGCVGLYALMSYEVVRRTHELGIRLALGATQDRIKWMLLRDGALLIGPALAIGIPAGIAASRLLSPQLYGVQHNDPWTLVSVAVVLTLIALVATFKPARAAAHIDPLSLLHHE